MNVGDSPDECLVTMSLTDDRSSGQGGPRDGGEAGHMQCVCVCVCAHMDSAACQTGRQIASLVWQPQKSAAMPCELKPGLGRGLREVAAADLAIRMKIPIWIT